MQSNASQKNIRCYDAVSRSITGIQVGVHDWSTYPPLRTPPQK